MAEEPEEIKLSTEQKTALLNLGLKAAEEGPKDKADLLYDILNNPLPVDGSAISMLPAPLRGLSRKVRSIAGPPIVDVLTSSKTSLSVIETIKEHAKSSGKSAKSEAMTEVLLAVYYAAIASGLKFHRRKITEHSNKHLAEAFGTLANNDWIPVELRDLLLEAQKLCIDEADP